MAASPVSLIPASVSNLSYSRRPPLALTPRRLAANRRNASRSTGPRTLKGKARVARNAIKHGFFTGAERWTAQERRDFADVFAGLCNDFKPQCAEEEISIATIADSYVRMAALLRYENIAALRYHQQCERELNERIAKSHRSEAARLEDRRDQLRRAGLWKPTIPGPREAMAIIRYEGSLNRAIRGAMADLRGFQRLRSAAPSHLKVQEQTHFVQQSGGISGSVAIPIDAIEGRGGTSSHLQSRGARGTSNAATSNPTTQIAKSAKTNRCSATPSSVLRLGEGPQVALRSTSENAKTKPLNPMITGNRHARRRAQALARRRT